MHKINKILIGIVIGGIIIYLIIFSQIEQSKYKEIDCHGEPVLVLKNPSDLFPVYATEYNKRLKLNFKVIDSVANIETNAEVKKKIRSFREKLNQENIRYQDLLKAKYESFTRFPCDKEAKKDFDDFLNKMNENTFEIEKTRINVYKIKKERIEVIPNIDKFKKNTQQKTKIIINTKQRWNNTYLKYIKVNKQKIFDFTPINRNTRKINYYSFYDKDSIYLVNIKEEKSILKITNNDTIKY